MNFYHLFPTEYEHFLRTQGYLAVSGVDEVGRGCLAGPVCAAAVIFSSGVTIEGVTDSKKLSSQRREELFKQICEKAVSYAVSFVDVQEIDRINILQASLKAMQQAIQALKPSPDFVLIDGSQSLDISIPQKTVVKGDLFCHSISAASILAKVSRDHLMISLQERYPNFAFATHKGYPTPQHRAELLRHGPTEIHRRSFRLFKPS